MIICPECELANPKENRFCQHCGFTLIVTCPRCSADVSYTEDQCPECDAWLSSPYLAFVVQGDPATLMTAGYIDSQQRYIITAVTESIQETSRGIRVIDTQPKTASYLEQTLKQEEENLLKLERDNKEALSDPNLWQQMGVPAIARHYLSLHEIDSIFPLLHDAWISAEHQIIVLENRQDFNSFTQYLKKQQVAYEQICHWILQMTQVWRELESIHCCQTLLNLDNLRLDGDQNLVLQRIFSDPLDYQPMIRELTELWQVLFDLPNVPQCEGFNDIVEETRTGAIDDVAGLQRALKKLLFDMMLVEIGHSPQPTQQGGEQSWEQRVEFTEEIEDYEDEPTEQILDPLNLPAEVHDQPTEILPMCLYSLDEVGMSDIGCQRDHNEDYFGIYKKIEKQATILGKTLHAQGLYIVCDGMGGHAAGEVASALSVETLQQYFQENVIDTLPDEQTIKDAIWRTNQTIYDININNSSSGSGRMGTTLVMIVVRDSQVAIAHVGDSRIYRISRKRGLEQLTIDHEVGQREIQRGLDPEAAYGRADAYQLTQAIGPRDNSQVRPDVNFFNLHEDCLFLLCSDGLSDNDLVEKYWEKRLLPLISSQANLEQGVADLIELANKHNGHDNITAVLVRLKFRPKVEEPQPMP